MAEQTYMVCNKKLTNQKIKISWLYQNFSDKIWMNYTDVKCCFCMCWGFQSSGFDVNVLVCESAFWVCEHVYAALRVVWVLQTVRVIQQDDSCSYWMRQRSVIPSVHPSIPPSLCAGRASLERGRRRICIPGRHRWMTIFSRSYYRCTFIQRKVLPFFFAVAKLNRKGDPPPPPDISADSSKLRSVSYNKTCSFSLQWQADK